MRGVHKYLLWEGHPCHDSPQLWKPIRDPEIPLTVVSSKQQAKWSVCILLSLSRKRSLHLIVRPAPVP